MATPNLHAVSIGNNFSAGDINQFQGTHAVTYIYHGASQVSYTTGAPGGSGAFQTNTGSANWIAQPFTTTGALAQGRIELYLAEATGTGVDVVMEIRTDSAGIPSNTALWSITIPQDFLTTSSAIISIPFVAALSATTKYHVVLDGTLSTTNFIKWSRNTTSVNQAVFSSTGTGGWGLTGFTALFNVWGTNAGVLRHICQDITANVPAGWLGYDYTNTVRDGSSVAVTVREIVGVQRSVRTLTYSSGALVSIA